MWYFRDLGFVADTQPSFFSNGTLTPPWITSCSMTSRFSTSLFFSPAASKVAASFSTRRIYVLAFWWFGYLWEVWSLRHLSSHKKTGFFLFTKNPQLCFHFLREKKSYAAIKQRSVILYIYLTRQSMGGSYLVLQLGLTCFVRYQVPTSIKKKHDTMAGLRTEIPLTWQHYSLELQVPLSGKVWPNILSGGQEKLLPQTVESFLLGGGGVFDWSFRGKTDYVSMELTVYVLLK